MGSASGLPPSKLAELEQGLDRLVAAVIARIAGAVARVIRGAPNSAAVNPVDDTAIVLPLWATAVTAELTPAVGAVWAASAATVAEEFTAAGLSTSPLGPDQAAAYLAQASNRLVGIGDIVWRQVASELAAGVEAGESIPELAARVQVAAGVSEHRATVIARSEVIAASNAGSFAQAQALNDPTMIKVWASSDDQRVRPAHVIADGQERPLLQPFEVGGEFLQFPGAPGGSAANNANERCTLLYRFDDGVVTAAVDGWNVTIVAAGDRTYIRDGDGQFARTPGEKLVADLKDVVGGAEDTNAVYFDDGRYIDMSTVGEDSDGNVVLSLEISNGGEDDDDTVQVDVDQGEAQQLLAAATATLLAPGEPDTSTAKGRLQALLQRATKGVTFPGGRYFDWGTKDENGSYRFEAGDDDGAVQFDLTPDEFERWVLSLGDAMIRGGAMTASVLTAAAEVHTGAMIALAPSAEDAYRLEVGDGEPAERLHSTLGYLGDDADLTPEQRRAILSLGVELAARGPLELDAFGVAIFNPTSDKRDTAIVLPLGGKEGPELAALHDAVLAGMARILGDAMPAQHEPYASHLTLAYTDDLSMAAEWTDRTGPVLFDHLRVAFGGDVYDIPMSSCGCGDPLTAAVKIDNNPEFNKKHLRGPGGRFRTMTERVDEAITSGRGLGEFDRPQLLKAAKAQGLTFKRGAPDAEIKKALIDAHGGDKKTPEVEAPKPAKAAAKKAAPAKKAAKAAPKVEEVPASAPAVENPTAGVYEGPEWKLPKGVKRADYDEYKALLHQQQAGTLEFEGSQRLNDIEMPRVVRVRAATEVSIEQEFEDFRQRNAPDKTAAELQQEMADSVREAFAGKRIAVRTTPRGLKSLLEDGRFRTHFEGARTQSNDPSTRPIREEAIFGIPEDSDPKKRPIYGYVMVDGERPAGTDPEEDALSQYGQIQVVLKDDVRSRTSAMWGDSLDSGQSGLPSPIDDPEWRSFTASNKRGVISRLYSTMDRDPGAPLFQARTYAEADIHGGVTVDDIAEVLLPANATAALKKQLDEAGIPWRIPGEATPKKADSPPSAPVKAVKKAAKKRAPQKAAPEPPASADAGLTGDAALAAAPLRLGPSTGPTDLTPQQQAALTDYRGSDYFQINRQLRGQAQASSHQTPEAQAVIAGQIAAIDSAMGASPLGSDIQVRRRVDRLDRVFGDAAEGDMAGLEWTDGGFISTTTDPKVFAANPDEADVAVMTIRVPAGTGGVQLSDADYESEMLLQRGLKFRIASDTGPGPGRRIEVDVVPASEPAESDRSADVARINNTPIVGTPRRLGGTLGVTTLEEHEGGTLVRKNAERFGSFAERPDNYGRDPVDDMDAEELASLVAPAFGVNVPGLARTSPVEILMEHVDGTDGTDIVPWGGPTPTEITESDQGARIGLMDTIINNTDRNAGNWIRTPDGDLVAIDHAGAFESADFVMSPFAGAVTADSFSPEDLATIRTRLGAARPEFERLGRESWFDDMMTRLDGMAWAATGTGSRLS